MRKKSRTIRKISRRDFIKTTSTAVIGANIIGCNRKSSKPNLLFIWTDEQRADTMKIYGNHKIHTPNLNKLASESVVFQNPYVSQPVCTPSRSTVMTGLWPHQNTCVTNNIPLPENVKCFPEIVNDPDYISGYFGKWHLGDEIFTQHGFQEWKSIEDGYYKYYSIGKDQDQKSDYWHFLKDHGYEPDTKNNRFSRGFAARRPLEHCKPKFLEIKTIDFLKRNQNQPFMLYINFLEPHMPFYGPMDNEHDPKEVDIPMNFDDPLEANEPLRYRLLRQNIWEKGFGKMSLKTEQDWRRLIANYWGLVTQVDLSVGAILNTLADLGLDENTIVVYTSDHGDMMGSHKMLAKTVMYEESTKVPWLIRLPQVSRKQQVIQNNVSHIDMVPTILDIMNINSQQTLPGQSLLPLIQGGEVKEDHVFIEWNAFNKRVGEAESIMGFSKKEIDDAINAHIRTVISPDGWKLCLSNSDKSQLFNLTADPYETVNLFDSGKYQSIIGDLTAKIHQWQRQVKDSVDV
jgi:arylsulfatase A-like enzyme